MRLYSDFIIHLKNKNNNNLFWSYLLLALPVIDLAPPQHLHSKFSGATPNPPKDYFAKETSAG